MDQEPKDSNRRAERESDDQPKREDAFGRFEPQTEREEALYQMILQLRREVAELRLHQRVSGIGKNVHREIHHEHRFRPDDDRGPDEREAFRQKVTFQKIDVNKDGRIDPEGYNRFRDTVEFRGELSDLKSQDRDRDGKLPRNEFDEDDDRPVIRKRPERFELRDRTDSEADRSNVSDRDDTALSPKERAREERIFRQSDLDGNGSLDFEEFNRLFEGSEAESVRKRSRAFFRLADKNEDSRLSVEELLLWRSGRRLSEDGQPSPEAARDGEGPRRGPRDAVRENRGPRDDQ